MITATDLFCGAGGSSEGLRQAGWNVEERRRPADTGKPAPTGPRPVRAV